MPPHATAFLYIFTSDLKKPILYRQITGKEAGDNEDPLDSDFLSLKVIDDKEEKKEDDEENSNESDDS